MYSHVCKYRLRLLAPLIQLLIFSSLARSLAQIHSFPLSLSRLAHHSPIPDNIRTKASVTHTHHTHSQTPAGHGRNWRNGVVLPGGASAKIPGQRGRRRKIAGEKETLDLCALTSTHPSSTQRHCHAHPKSPLFLSGPPDARNPGSKIQPTRVPYIHVLRSGRAYEKEQQRNLKRKKNTSPSNCLSYPAIFSHIISDG